MVILISFFMDRNHVFFDLKKKGEKKLSFVLDHLLKALVTRI